MKIFTQRAVLAVVGAIMMLTIVGTHRAHAQCPQVTVFNNSGCTITVEFKDNAGNIVGPKTMPAGTNWLPAQPPGWTGVNSFRFSIPGLVPAWIGAWNAAGAGCGPCINAGCCCVQGCGTPALCRYDFNTCAPC